MDENQILPNKERVEQKAITKGVFKKAAHM